MTDTEINKALALKIGYLPEYVNADKDGLVSVCRTAFFGRYWSLFDYKDWRTIMPIAVKYGICMRPLPSIGTNLAYSQHVSVVGEAKTLQRAIALAVLGVKE